VEGYSLYFDAYWGLGRDLPTTARRKIEDLAVHNVQYPLDCSFPLVVGEEKVDLRRNLKFLRESSVIYRHTMANGNNVWMTYRADRDSST
jgi:hypothetical protein